MRPSAEFITSTITYGLKVYVRSDEHLNSSVWNTNTLHMCEWFTAPMRAVIWLVATNQWIWFNTSTHLPQVFWNAYQPIIVALIMTLELIDRNIALPAGVSLPEFCSMRRVSNEIQNMKSQSQHVHWMELLHMANNICPQVVAASAL